MSLKPLGNIRSIAGVWPQNETALDGSIHSPPSPNVLMSCFSVSGILWEDHFKGP